jgi:CRP-like cAMP-binding protein
MAMTEIEKYLSKLVNFERSELDTFNGLLKLIEIEKDEFFLKEGQVCTKIGFILEGSLEMTYVDENLEEHILEFIFPNSFATDYVSLLTEKKSDSNIKATTKSKLVYFTKEDLNQLYESSFNFQKLGRLISESYFIGFANRIKKTKLSPKQRYEMLLSENPEFVQALPQYKIASYLGISAEWLSKVRGKK